MAIFRSDLFNSHLEEAARVGNVYGRFDARWKAFNVFYKSLLGVHEKPPEWELIHRAVEQVSTTGRIHAISEPALARFLKLDPVFDEQVWTVHGRKMDGRHLRAVRALKAARQQGQASVEDMKMLADALYVVRCNAAHGFKTPNGPRDREVFEVATPLLHVIVADLALQTPHRAAV